MDIGQIHKPLWLLFLTIAINFKLIRSVVEIVVQKKNDQVEHLAGVAMLKHVHGPCHSIKFFGVWQGQLVSLAILTVGQLTKMASAGSRPPHYSRHRGADRSAQSHVHISSKGVSPLNTITTHRPLVSQPRPLYPLISLTHSHPLPPMTSFHRVTLPSAQATAKTFPARLHETLQTASGKSGSGLSDP